MQPVLSQDPTLGIWRGVTRKCDHGSCLFVCLFFCAVVHLKPINSLLVLISVQVSFHLDFIL